MQTNNLVLLAFCLDKKLVEKIKKEKEENKNKKKDGKGKSNSLWPA